MKCQRQTSVQINDDIKQKMADLAEAWGLPKQRHVTPIFVRLVTEAHAKLSAQKELDKFYKACQDNEDY